MQIITIFKKESRQQGVLAAAMVLLCFGVQLTGFIMTLFPDTVGQRKPEFFGIALLMTALFTGAAAALSFSAEHDEKTFGFLRNLPITPLTVMLGKTAWLIFSTLIVFTVSSLLALAWEAVTVSHYDKLSPSAAIGTFGVGILEAFVWGLFWSPRCRNQVYALLATYFCASIVSYGCAVFCSTSTGVIELYCHAVPFRLGIVAVVAVFAVHGALKWFDIAVQKQSRYTATERRSIFRYPLRPQSPFFALLHQSVRQSFPMLFSGVIATIYFCGILLIVGLKNLSDMPFFIHLSFLSLGIFYIVFCGSIFAQDQKNHSFRFLSRCGISARNIWQSRVLPFAAVLLLNIAVCAVVILFYLRKVINVNPDFGDDIVLRYLISTYFALWLIPFASGAFLSVYCRSMIVSVALTGSLSLLLFGWMITGVNLCMFNPYWTTLPICVMLLAASRFYTTDWLRERRTWKSRLVPMVPLFVTVIAVLAAIPPVRIYSVPYVSLEEAEALLDETPLFERLSPADRKALFQETAARLTHRLTENDIDRIKYWYNLDFYYIYVRNFDGLNNFLPEDKLKKLIEHRKKECKDFEEEVKTIPPFETWLLYDYEIKTRIINAGLEHIALPFSDGNLEKNLVSRCRYFSWEKARLLRRFNYQLRYQLHLLTLTNKEWMFRYENKYDVFFSGSLDRLPFEWATSQYSRYSYHYSVRTYRLNLVQYALCLWYWEHGNTLPNSLEELVGEYLHEIPVEPLTGTAMEYHPNGDDFAADGKVSIYGHKAGSPHLVLGGQFCDLHFLPEYKER